MNRLTVCLILLSAVVSPSFLANASPITILHSFTQSPDGAYPYGGLVLSGSTLYGMTAGGGSGYGTVFKVNTDQSGYSVLHTFTDGFDGADPHGSFTLSGSTLYGTTNDGGAFGGGNLLKVNTDNTGFSILHSFGSGSDGYHALGDLTVTGATLYGMTRTGGTNGKGTVFKINTDQSGYTVMHSFGSGSDGAQPFYGALALSGSTLYGMTYGGGSNGAGTIFKINTDNSGYAVLHSFGTGSDGANPYAGLVLSGSTLYGMTCTGGDSGNGTIFKINTDNSGYSILHSFMGGSDGLLPYGSLSLSGSTLYGMTYGGGSSSKGTVFDINTGGSGYTVLHAFTGYPEGAYPYGSLAVSGSTLYGMTSSGGSDEYIGSVFSMNAPIPEPSTFALMVIGALALFCLGCWRGRRGR